MPIVYSITSPSGKVYVGSTEMTVHKRKALHKSNYLRWKEGTVTERCSSCILFDEGLDACVWEILEECEKEVMLMRERHWIDSLTCVNKCLPYKTDEEKAAYESERAKAYYESHKEERLAYGKAYRAAHKEANREKHRERLRKWRAENRDKWNEYQRAYYASKKTKAQPAPETVS